MKILRKNEGGVVEWRELTSSPLNLIDSIWWRFPQCELPKPLRPSVKETLCYSWILQLFLIPYSCTKKDASLFGKLTTATPPQETEDLKSFGFVASRVDSGSEARAHSEGMGCLAIRARDE